MNSEKKTCLVCPRHCAEDALSCERGRSFFQGDAGNTREHGHFQESGDGHGHGTHHGRSHGGSHGNSHGGSHGNFHGNFEDKVSKDSLSGILAQCGHHIFHCQHDGKRNDEEIFAGLSDLEKKELKKLLTKLLDSWEAR